MTRARLAATVAAVAGLLLALVAGPAQATHSWSDYHWARTANPFTLQVVDSVTATWQSEFDIALAEWSASTSPIDFNVASADDANRTRKQCKTVTGQIRVCNAAYGQNGWLGLATINLDSNRHITQGTAKMNDSYDWYFTPDEMRHVMCQEIGHLFGLGHTSEDGSSQQTCMDYSTDPKSISPSGHDYEQLQIIYGGHVDSYSSYDTGSSGGGGGGGGGGCKGPAWKCGGSSVDGRDYGALVSSSDHQEVWVKRNADGGFTLTHLYLAP